MPIRIARKKRNDYENFIAECPYCGRENIFNRISDLKTVEPIGFKEVRCFECPYRFKINGDRIGESYEYLIYDCEELLRIKRYMYCILNLCQACEAFLYKAIEVKLILEPWTRNIFRRDVDRLNRCSKEFFRKTKSFSYIQLLNIFYDLYLNRKTFNSEQDIIDYIDQLNQYAKNNHSKSAISRFPEKRTRELLLDLKSLNIHEMRNKVVHKYAYRPRLSDVEKYLEEVRSVVFGLRTRLRIRSTIMYLNR